MTDVAAVEQKLKLEYGFQAGAGASRPNATTGPDESGSAAVSAEPRLIHPSTGGHR